MNSDLYYHKVEVPVVTSFVCEVTITTSKFLSYGELRLLDLARLCTEMCARLSHSRNVAKIRLREDRTRVIAFSLPSPRLSRSLQDTILGSRLAKKNPSQLNDL